ncbi:hypothetical protein FCV25MIE_30795 [Fagus crenata]
MGLIWLMRHLKEHWDEWGIEAQVFASFALQITLTFFANRRRYTPGVSIRFITWSSYLLSGFLAKVALGKLSEIQIPQDKKYHLELKALLAPLLFLQIGNPDCLTALSIEDNRLGLRQFLGLFFQVSSVVWILVKSWKISSLKFLYLPMFLAGFTKYGEAIWALKSALSGNSGLTISELDQEENVPSLFRVLPENNPMVELILKAYYRFNCLKPHLNNWLYQPFYESLPWIALDNYSPEEVFKITDVELGFMYDVLYTKAPIIYTRKGFFLRIISLLGLVGTICGFLILYKNPFNDEKACFTFILMIGAVILEVYQIILLPFSDWAIIQMITCYNKPVIRRLLHILAPRSSKWKRWSNSLAQFNLLNFCLQYEQFKFSKILIFQDLDMEYKKFRSRYRVEFPKDLKELIVQEMKEVDKERGSKPFTQRGEWALKRYGCLDYDFKWSVKRDFDKSIIIWHIATYICYHSDVHCSIANSRIEMSKLLSNYMMYLLVMRPHMLCITTSGIVFEHACTKLLAFMRTGPLIITEEVEACRILRTHDLPNQSNLDRKRETMVTLKWHMLHDAQRLAQKLMDKEDRWQIISSVWMEMLFYAASNCPMDNHADQLRRGGGLITHVWLLLAHKTDKFYTSD